MADRDYSGRRGRQSQDNGGDATQERNMAKSGKARTILTDGAIFHKDKMHESVTLSPDGDHHIASPGDVVMLTDEEFNLHRNNGVCLVDAEEVRQAAE